MLAAAWLSTCSFSFPFSYPFVLSRMLPHAAHLMQQHLPATSFQACAQPTISRSVTNLVPSHALLAHSPAGPLSSSGSSSNSCRSSRGSRRRSPIHLAPPPSLLLSSFATSAAAKSSADTSPQGPGVAASAATMPKSTSALATVQQAGIQIPQYCCGCGVKLQQVDPEGSG